VVSNEMQIPDERAEAQQYLREAAQGQQPGSSTDAILTEHHGRTGR
jgi:hypothetical protein